MTRKSKSSKNQKLVCLDEFAERHECAHECVRAVPAPSALDVLENVQSARVARTAEVTSLVLRGSLMANLARSDRRVPRVNPQLRGINSL